MKPRYYGELNDTERAFVQNVTTTAITKIAPIYGLSLDHSENLTEALSEWVISRRKQEGVR